MSVTPHHWHKHNRFKLLVDSREFYPEMLDAIASATRSIYLEQYLVASGRIFNQFSRGLIEAAHRGVDVYVLLDDYGSKGVTSSDREALLDSGIKLAFYNPLQWKRLYTSLRRNHRKLLIIDSRLAFVGGAGISDDYHPEVHSKSWHDTVIKIQGEVVADWLQSFIGIWEQATRTQILPPTEHISLKEHQPGRVAISDGPGRNHIIRHAIAEIKKSRQRVWIATPYFVTTHKLRRALKAAAQRKVDVRLLLPGEHSDHSWISYAARNYYTRLLKNGVKIFEYQPRFIHAKLIICDNWVSAGSSNLDRWNQYWNLDSNQEIKFAGFAEQVKTLFEQDFVLSQEITPAYWKRRPIRQRLKEWWSGHQIRLLQWLTFFVSRIKKKAD